MADSDPKQAEKGIWLLVVTGPRQDCLVTPQEAGYYLYADEDPSTKYSPAAIDGHTLLKGENFNAVPVTGQSLWFMCPTTRCRVWITDRPAA